MKSILANINDYVTKYLDGDIENPLLKKVIIDEITFSNDFIDIVKQYLLKIVLSGDIIKLNIIVDIINKLSLNCKDIILAHITCAFISLSNEEQMFLIMNINDENKIFFKFLNYGNDGTNGGISLILQNIGTLLISNKLYNSPEYIIKYIHACNTIDSNYGLIFMEYYINNNCLDLVSDNTLLAYFISKYSLFNKFKELTSLNNLIDNIKLKLISIKIHIDNLPLDNMNMAFEIYKLGKIILDSNLEFSNKYMTIQNNPVLHNTLKINFSKEQLEYIVKSIHTCIINNNILQAKTILCVVYYLHSSELSKFIEYYNYWLLIRINKQSNIKVLQDEEEIWKINNVNLNKLSIFNNYIRIINNLIYSNNINNDLQKVIVKNVLMNKVNVTLVNDIETSNILQINHHPSIQKYITSLDKYINKRSILQKIEHDNINSKITFNTSHGSIKCSLLIGSLLLYLNDGDKTIDELKTILNISNITKYIQILTFNNLVVNYVKETNTYYKYVIPFGNVVCDESDINVLNKDIELKFTNFTDIILTMESRIVKETKFATKINIIELERKIQEYLKDEYIRTMFYQRLESLKSRYYIEQDNDIILYVV